MHPALIVLLAILGIALRIFLRTKIRGAFRNRGNNIHDPYAGASFKAQVPQEELQAQNQLFSELKRDWPLNRNLLPQALMVKDVPFREKVFAFLAMEMKATDLRFWMENLDLLDYHTVDYLKIYLDRHYHSGMRGELEQHSSHPRVSSWLKNFDAKNKGGELSTEDLAGGDLSLK
jgi:hypothetical protein